LGTAGDRAQGRADDGLGDEGHDVIAAQRSNFVLELASKPLRVIACALVGTTLAILVNGRDMMRLDQERSELFALRFAPADRERAQGDAVIALPARNNEPPLRLTALDETLTCQLERRLDRLRAAADEEHMLDALWRVRYEIVGQCLGDRRGEKAGVGVFECIELRTHGGEHARMRMAQTRDRRTAGGIDVFLSVRVAEHNAASAHRAGVAMIDLPMQDVGHGCAPEPPRRIC
jgi:hypothetical protein